MSSRARPKSATASLVPLVAAAFGVPPLATSITLAPEILNWTLVQLFISDRCRELKATNTDGPLGDRTLPSASSQRDLSYERIMCAHERRNKVPIWRRKPMEQREQNFRHHSLSG